MEQVGRRIQGQLANFEKMISEIEPDLNARVNSVSAWTPAQHLDHVLKVCSAVISVVEQNRPVDAPGISMLGRLVLFAGRIPRGRGKSPEKVIGLEGEKNDLERLLNEVKESLEKILCRSEQLASSRKIFLHPYFRALTASQALRFCEVHNNHHRRIILDVLRASQSR